LLKTHRKTFHNLDADFLALLFLLVMFTISGATVRAELLPVKTYTVADGLLRDNIYKIRQDSYGYLWFCTAEGVSRFDGYGFMNFTTEDGLPDRHVNDILETSKGNYLIATDRGLAELNPKGLRGSAENPLFKVLLPEPPRAVKFRVLFEDKSGTIWAGASGGLFRLREIYLIFKQCPQILTVQRA
jgi:ligand-binding sensor domain-containing protein